MTDYMTKQEAADYLRVSCATIDRYVRQGHLRAYRISGGSRRFKAEEVQNLITAEPKEA
jgi:excisionase family DNA binding protein